MSDNKPENPAGKPAPEPTGEAKPSEAAQPAPAAKSAAPAKPQTKAPAKPTTRPKRTAQRAGNAEEEPVRRLPARRVWPD